MQQKKIRLFQRKVGPGKRVLIIQRGQERVPVC
jgi:hypothetical protein